MSTVFESRLWSSLTGNAGLSALIGNRLYLIQLPAKPTYPCMTYQRIATVPLTVNSSAAFQGAGWARFQFTSFSTGATSGQQSDAIARALQAAMHAFNGGAASDSNYPNFMLGRQMRIEPQTDPPLFIASLDFRIFYQES